VPQIRWEVVLMKWLKEILELLNQIKIKKMYKFSKNELELAKLQFEFAFDELVEWDFVELINKNQKKNKK
jgi:hypothetical protein